MELNLTLHTFEVEGVIYQQDPKKGVIGLNAQRCGCRCYTIQWMIKYRSLLEMLTNMPVQHAINKHQISEQIINDIIDKITKPKILIEGPLKFVICQSKNP